MIKNFTAWKIQIDEALFLGGLSKGEFLSGLGDDFFFDDQQQHCEEESFQVATRCVPHGVRNSKEGVK